MKTVEQHVKAEIAKKLEINIEAIDNRASLENLGADSMDCLEILMRIENEFEIEIDDEIAAQCNTVGAIVALVESFRNHK